MKSIFASLAVSFLFSCVGFGYDWAVNPGTGTVEDPYLIWEIDQLTSIGSDSSLLDKHYRLVADIDLTGVVFSGALIAPDTDQVTDGFQGSYFTGTFDGGGHVIKNLTMTTTERRDYIGFIGGFIGFGQL